MKTIGRLVTRWCSAKAVATALALAPLGCSPVLGLDAPTETCASVSPDASGPPVCGGRGGVPADAFVQIVTADLGGSLTGHLTLPRVAAGDAIVVAADAYPITGSYALVVADDTTCFTPVVGPDPAVGRGYVFAAFDVAGGDHDIVFTSTGTVPTYLNVYVHEYRGVGSFDRGQSFASDAGAPSGSLRTTCQSELLFGFAVSTGSLGPGVTGLTLRSNASQNVTGDAVVGPGQHAAGADNGGALGWSMMLAAFAGK